jgi:hypothetical protein
MGLVRRFDADARGVPDDEPKAGRCVRLLRLLRLLRLTRGRALTSSCEEER